MSEEEDLKAATLKALSVALENASACGALDDLPAACSNPDSVNDFCDAVSYSLGMITGADFREAAAGRAVATEAEDAGQ